MPTTNVYFTDTDRDVRVRGYRQRWTDDHDTDHDAVTVHIGPVSLDLPPQLAERVRDALAEQLADGGQS